MLKRKKLHFFVIYQNRENKSVKFVKKIFLAKTKMIKVLVNLNLLWSRPQKYYSNWHGKWKHDGGVIAQLEASTTLIYFVIFLENQLKL